jgi:hypothetical protein
VLSSSARDGAPLRSEHQLSLSRGHASLAPGCKPSLVVGNHHRDPGKQPENRHSVADRDSFLTTSLRLQSQRPMWPVASRPGAQDRLRPEHRKRRGSMTRCGSDLLTRSTWRRRWGPTPKKSVNTLRLPRANVGTEMDTTSLHAPKKGRGLGDFLRSWCLGP